MQQRADHDKLVAMTCVICGKTILPGETYMAPPPVDAPWHSPACPTPPETALEETRRFTKAEICAIFQVPERMVPDKVVDAANWLAGLD